MEYVQRVHDLRKRFPAFAILPELEYGYAFGLRMLEWIDERTPSAQQLLDEQVGHLASLFDHLEGSPERCRAALESRHARGASQSTGDGL